MSTVSQSVVFCSGYGQFHTNKPDAENRKPYATISMADIQAMASTPTSVAKEKGQWVIFSDYTGEHGRNAEYLRNNGALFYALWGDIDEAAGVTAEDILKRTAFGVTRSETIVYTSRSATEANQKARIIVPLAEPVDAITFEIMQEVLNNKLEAEGLKPDRVTETCQQLCYLPNKGKFYWSDSLVDFDGYDTLTPSAWAKEVAAIVAEREAEEEAARVRMAASKARFTELILTQEFLPREAAKQAYDARDLWIVNGAKVRSGGRLLSPFSKTGSAGITFKDGKWFSSHGSDAALGIGRQTKNGRARFGDEFDLICFFNYNNDEKAAAAALSVELDGDANKQRQIAHAKAKEEAETKLMFDAFSQPEPVQEVTPEQDNQRNPSKFASILAGTQIGRYATQLADERQMPRDTTVLAALGIISAPVSMIYTVGYRYASHIPTSLYVATEQPASSGKSGILDAFMLPMQQAIRDMNIKAAKHNEETDEDDTAPKFPQYRAFVTDATPESLDGLIGKQFGHFCLASAEQGLVNTALGLNYGNDKKSNNDLILKGATGDWHSSARVTRQGYEGNVFGSVTVIAQRGTIDTILEQSNGTGIAERFIMLAEPTLLGYRDHVTSRPRADYDLRIDYCNAMDALIKKYDQIRMDFKASYEDLECLKLSQNDWHKLEQVKQRLEPTMADDGKFSHELLRGVVGKFDQRAMKLASVLHVFEAVMAGNEVSTLIDSRYVDMAIELAELSIDQLYKAMTEKGLIGMSAEEEAIYRLASSKGANGVLWGELYNAAKGVQPFKSYGSKGLAARIKAICAGMEKRGVLSVAQVSQGGRPVNKIFAQ